MYVYVVLRVRLKFFCGSDTDCDPAISVPQQSVLLIRIIGKSKIRTNSNIHRFTIIRFFFFRLNYYSTQTDVLNKTFARQSVQSTYCGNCSVQKEKNYLIFQRICNLIRKQIVIFTLLLLKIVFIVLFIVIQINKNIFYV